MRELLISCKRVSREFRHKNGDVPMMVRRKSRCCRRDAGHVGTRVPPALTRVHALIHPPTRDAALGRRMLILIRLPTHDNGKLQAEGETELSFAQPRHSSIKPRHMKRETQQDTRRHMGAGNLLCAFLYFCAQQQQGSCSTLNKLPSTPASDLCHRHTHICMLQDDGLNLVDQAK